MILSLINSIKLKVKLYDFCSKLGFVICKLSIELWYSLKFPILFVKVTTGKFIPGKLYCLSSEPHF